MILSAFYICILDANELTGTKQKQIDCIVHRQIWFTVVPHSLSSPRTELYLHGQRDHRVALYNCDGREKDDLDLIKNTTAMTNDKLHTFWCPTVSPCCLETLKPAAARGTETTWPPSPNHYETSARAEPEIHLKNRRQTEAVNIRWWAVWGRDVSHGHL